MVQKLIGKRTGNGAKNKSSASRIKNYVQGKERPGGQVGFQQPRASTSGGGGQVVGTAAHISVCN